MSSNQKKNLLYTVAAIVAVVFTSCEKKPENNENEDINCYNYNTAFVDSVTPVYFTMISNSRAEIGRTFEGNTTVLITDAGYDYWSPAVSPDGTKLICYRSPNNDNTITDDFANAELWMFDINGSNGKKILSLNDHNWSKMGMARWAPNGTHLVMAAEKADATDGFNPHWHLFATDTGGNIPVQLSSRASFFSFPEINAAGTKITYTALPIGFLTGTNESKEIFVADINTSTWTMTNEQQLTSDSDYDYAPRFSPDGLKIAFTTQTTSNTKLAVDIRKINSDGSNLTDVVKNGEANAYPSWNAAGTHIMFSYLYSSTCFWSMVRVKEDGTEFGEIIKKINAHLTQIEF